jgi:hypothetical protein
VANLFQREPALVIGSVVTALVTVYAYWRGLEVGEVLVQLAALIASFVAVRARVTPYVKGALGEVNRLRGRSDVGDNGVL